MVMDLKFGVSVAGFRVESVGFRLLGFRSRLCRVLRGSRPVLSRVKNGRVNY
jgi:hypothetical protein